MSAPPARPRTRTSRCKAWSTGCPGCGRNTVVRSPLDCLDKGLPVQTWGLRGLYAQICGPCQSKSDQVEQGTQVLTVLFTVLHSVGCVNNAVSTWKRSERQMKETPLGR